MPGLRSLLSDLISDVVLSPVHVAEVESIGTRFTQIRIEGHVFEDCRWTPGDKLQLRVQRGSVALRTYTPINWQADPGSVELIAFHHGRGPGARWFDSASVGTECEVFGPSRSIDLSDSVGNVVFIGDETSVALADALRSVNPLSRFIFEATDPGPISSVLTTLGFPDTVEIVVKSNDRRPLLEHAREAGEEFGSAFDFVVSGDAATVSAARRAMRHWHDLRPRIKARAYWAKGRSGLS